jgi:hypothetical protein
MKLFGKDEPETATVKGQPFNCLVCKHNTFWEKRAQMHGALLSFLDLEWLGSPTCDCLVCSECGHVHWFLE